MSTGIRRIKNPPLLRSFRQFAAPCVLVVLIVVFGVTHKRSARTVSVTTQQFSRGTVVTGDDIAKDRGYIRYQVPGRGERYFLNPIANKFKVDGGWRKIAELTLKHNGKEATAKDIYESQFRLETGQILLIPL
jgi:hypothetical protein